MISRRTTQMILNLIPVKRALFLSLSLWLGSITLHPYVSKAAVRAVGSTPDIAWLMKEVGGAEIEVQSLLKGTEDPHYADAVPDFIRKVAHADIVCAVGLELEVGWLPRVLSRSGNSKIQSGGLGFCEVGVGVKTLERPTGNIDRSMGDVHPLGNPHFWLSPVSMKEAAVVVADKLSKIDPAHSQHYQANLRKLHSHLDQLVHDSKRVLAPILKKNPASKVLEYHREFTYLFQLYGIPTIGSIEEKPGVPPSAGRLLQVARQAQSSDVKLIIGTDFTPLKPLEKVSEVSGIPIWTTPISLQPSKGIVDYLNFHRTLVKGLADRLASN